MRGLVLFAAGTLAGLAVTVRPTGSAKVRHSPRAPRSYRQVRALSSVSFYYAGHDHKSCQRQGMSAAGSVSDRRVQP